MKLIEEYSHSGEGYNPFLITEGWQVAILNYSRSEDIDEITNLDVHYETDEAFLLIQGDIVLISASIDADKVTYENVKLKPGIVYNIPKNVWHKVAMKPGSSVLIVEKDKTHLGDFEFHNLNSIQIEELRKDVNSKFSL